MRFFWILLEGFFRLIRKMERTASRHAALSSGLKIGNGSMMIGEHKFGSEPFLVSIGKNCLITDGVRFITHDGSIQVPLLMSGEKMSDVYSKKSTFSPITIGDNVFIGVNSVILPGAFIRDNSIVAAGSVVKGEFPEGVVIGGNPAKYICSTEEYFKKNSSRILNLSPEIPRHVQIINAIGES